MPFDDSISAYTGIRLSGVITKSDFYLIEFEIMTPIQQMAGISTHNFFDVNIFFVPWPHFRTIHKNVFLFFIQL